MLASISKEIPELSSKEVEYLEKLGLSDHEIQVYQVLRARQCEMTAQAIANVLMVYPNALYRIFGNLKKHGLIKRTKKRPMAFKAIDQSVALRAAYTTKNQELKTSLNQLGLATPGHRDIIIGREAMYETYARLAVEAKHEIAVFAIGIAYSEDLYQVQQQAIERGVYIRHVVQQVKPSNYNIVHKWQRLGVSMRHSPEERGFHLTIVDRAESLITFSDPEDTDDRISIMTDHPAAVKMFQSQFESIWHVAQEVPRYK